jgi:hypothetical protein
MDVKLICHYEGTAQTEDASEQAVEPNIWTQKGEVIGDRRFLYNEKLHNFISSTTITRKSAQDM